MRNTSLSSLIKLASDVNVAPLLSEILRHHELWNQHRARTNAYGTPHGDISDIWVRYNAFENFDGDLAKFNEPHESVWYPAFEALPSIRPIVFDLMRAVEGERLGGVLITKIPAGSKVEPHIDHGWHARYYEKFAVQIMSAPEQAFCFDGEAHVQRPGDIYTFDNAVTHWVTNDSSIERITMICCIRRREPCRGD